MSILFMLLLVCCCFFFFLFFVFQIPEAVYNSTEFRQIKLDIESDHTIIVTDVIQSQDCQVCVTGDGEDVTRACHTLAQFTATNTSDVKSFYLKGGQAGKAIQNWCLEELNEAKDLIQ